METSPSALPATGNSTRLYYQIVYTLTDLLPPPLDTSPEALRARNQAAIAKVAAMLPVNANEIDLAAQCIAARAQAEEMLRLIRQNADDIALVLRLNAQYASMLRTSLSVEGRLMRVQAVRRKREAIEGAATEDAWTQHVTENSMLAVAELDAERLQPVQPEAAPAPAVDHKTPKNVSENKTNSHNAAFEMLMSAPPWNPGAGDLDETLLNDAVREAMAGLRVPKTREQRHDVSANGRGIPVRVNADPSTSSRPSPDVFRRGP